jgi:hypothetical protein
MKNKAIIVFLVLLYGVVNYLGYIFRFDFINNHLMFLKDYSEFLKNDEIILCEFDLKFNRFYGFLFSLNLHIFLIGLFLQYKISILLNGNNNIKILLFILVFFYLLRHLTKQITDCNIHQFAWIAKNVFSRSVKIHKLLFAFPTLPFLIFIINKSISNKPIKKAKS